MNETKHFKHWNAAFPYINVSFCTLKKQAKILTRDENM